MSEITKPTSKRRRQKGAAMIESALVLLSTLMVILGTLDVGQVFLFTHFYNERARAGARWAAVHAYDVDAIKNYVCYGTAAAGTTGFLGLTPANVNVTRTGLPDTFSDRIRVTISRPVQFFSPWFPSTWNPPTADATSPAESLGAAF